MASRILALEGLRGLMAWWVVLGHIAHTFGRDIGERYAVPVFIIHSGFVIFRLIDQKRETYSAYITRRALRLFPLYLAVLLVSVALLPLFQEAIAGLSGERNALRAAQAAEAIKNLPAHFWVHVPLLQGVVPDRWLPQGAYTIVGQAWSISLEWQFYLLAPLAFLAIMQKHWLPLAASVAILLLLAPINGAFLGNYALLFGVGIATYMFMTGKWSIIAPVAFGAGWLVTGGSVLPLVIWALAFVPMVRDRLASGPFIYLGERCYSTYLVHMIPLYLGLYFFGPSPLVIPLTIAATALISHFTYQAIEKPGMALGVRLASRSPARPAPIGP